LELKDLNGATVRNRDLVGDGRGILFFFVSPTCEPCQALIPDFLEWQNKLDARVRIVFVSSGRADENRQKFEELADATILLDIGRRLALSVGGKWTPTALYIDPKGNIASHVAAGDIAIEELVEKVDKADLDRPFTYFASANHNGRGMKIGVEAPAFKLASINGGDVKKDDLIGKKTLLTFWSPTCPHCTAFLEEFKKWESSRSNGDPQVILISDGDADQHENLGVKSPVVMDEGYKTSAKLGMFGTPSAVLINEDGIIQTETAVGARNIWALLGRQNETN
jgi:peroxiredoxin